MDSCGADWRGNRLDAAPLNFARHWTRVSLGSQAKLAPWGGLLYPRKRTRAALGYVR
jgi:hypothetical protein